MREHAADQINSIHTMMSSGHRSVRMERHTLLLWGVAGALLIIIMRLLYPPEDFSIKWHRTLVVNAISITVLVAIAIWDVRLTRRSREARDETISFVQIQLTKVWWSIVALIILIQIGMSFFGGGYLFFAILLSLLGLAFYIHGLFSQQLLSWAGSIMIFLGLACIALRLPIATQEWLTVMVLGIGFPSLGYLIQNPQHNRNVRYRVAGFTVWLLLIILPAVAVDRWQRDYKVPDVPVISLADYQRNANDDNATKIVRLPTGTVIPLEVTVNGSILENGNSTVVPLQLSESLDVILKDNKPTGLYRVSGDQWHDRRYAYRIRDVDISSLVSHREGPIARLTLFISTDQ
jgi:hypothetical protein